MSNDNDRPLSLWVRMSVQVLQCSQQCMYLNFVSSKRRFNPISRGGTHGCLPTRNRLSLDAQTTFSLIFPAIFFFGGNTSIRRPFWILLVTADRERIEFIRMLSKVRRPVLQCRLGRFSSGHPKIGVWRLQYLLVLFGFDGSKYVVIRWARPLCCCLVFFLELT